MIDAMILRRPFTSDWRVLVGGLSLAAAAALVIVLPPSWVTIPLALIATFGLAANRRLGWLGAGLLVVMTIPYGRGADSVQIAGVPFRPHDAVIAVAVIGSLRTVRFGPWWRSTLVVATSVWLLIGLVAIVIGLMNDNAIRDVFRDVRWWGLYAVGAVAVLGTTRRDQVVRGLCFGAIGLAAVLIVATVLPPFQGALKAGVLLHDRGTLRMHFGNSALLLAAIAYYVRAALRFPRFGSLATLGIVLVVPVLSLTRVSIIVTAFVVLLVVAVFVWERRSELPRSLLASRISVIAAIAVVAFIGGIGLSTVGIVTARGLAGGGENPLSRITFTEEESDIDSIVNAVDTGGRLTTYLNALAVIQPSPVLGRGLGTLVDVPFAYSSERAYTIGKQPGVDNAYLTAALKGGGLAAAALAMLFLLPLMRGVRVRWLRAWYIPAWLGLCALTLTQSFAVSSYGPFGVSLLASVPFLGYARRRAWAARVHEYSD